MFKDSAAIIISSLALLVSYLSYRNSRRNLERDEAKLVATSYLIYRRDNERPQEIIVKIANAGRRPLIVRLLGGTDDDGNGSASYLGDYKTGHRLGEGDFIEEHLDWSGITSENEGDLIEFTSLYVEDSLGNRHEVQNSRANIDLYSRQLPRPARQELL